MSNLHALNMPVGFESPFRTKTSPVFTSALLAHLIDQFVFLVYLWRTPAPGGR
jgi:hypothetical protein